MSQRVLLLFVALFASVTACAHQDGVTRSPIAGPRPMLVAVLPFDTSNGQYAVPDVDRSCLEGALSTKVAIIDPLRVRTALRGLTPDQVDDATARAIAADLGADAVIKGYLNVGHFSSGVDAVLIRTATGVHEMTASYSSTSDGLDAAKLACAALLR